MTYLYQGVIYHKNIPIYDILLKSCNKKISLWYLIRLYYEKKRSDLFESFIFFKLKHLLSTEKKDTFVISYAQFSLENKSLLSTLLFFMSNNIINLSSIYTWTQEFNTIYPQSSICIRQRLIFDTDSRIFNNNLNIKDNNFEKINTPLDIQYKLKNIYHKLIIEHTDSNVNHKLLSDNVIESTLNNKIDIKPINFQNYKANLSTKLDKFIPSNNTSSLLDDYNKWSIKNKYNRYTLNSLLLLDNRKNKK